MTLANAAKIILLHCAILLLFPANASAIKPDRKYIKYPGDFGLEYESVVIKTKDNYDLRGWYIKSQAGSAKGTIIFSGPDAGNMSYLLDPMPMFIHHGYNVLLFDYRGFGESQDFDIDPDILVYPEFLDDLHSVVDYVKAKGEKKIILFGISMGAAISTGIPGQRDDILAVIADGAYTTLDEVVKLVNQKLLEEESDRRFKIPNDYPVSALPINAVRNYGNTSVFFLAGSDDKVTTPGMSMGLYKACSSMNKSLWIAANTMHGSIAHDYGQLYFDNILAFLDRLSM
ncbi:MAG: alpha/beta fold hydrolase [Fidelibacterota bacterium]|nr:MAG: alpha/beta fold hydrolase [Candidatus Neomarinimicrobiota bacterium]